VQHCGGGGTAWPGGEARSGYPALQENNLTVRFRKSRCQKRKKIQEKGEAIHPELEKIELTVQYILSWRGLFIGEEHDIKHEKSPLFVNEGNKMVGSPTRHGSR
jgi:hypothetical protein